jgi:hypothetical protein
VSGIDICWCGHNLDRHFVTRDSCCDEHGDFEYPVCNDCIHLDGYFSDHWFEPDNLKYLERLSENVDKKPLE